MLSGLHATCLWHMPVPADCCGVRLLLLMRCCVVEVVHCHLAVLCRASFQSASVACSRLAGPALALSFSFVGLWLRLCLPSFAVGSISLSNRSLSLVLPFPHSFVPFSMPFSGLAFVTPVSFPLVAFAFVNGSYVHWCDSSGVAPAHARAWRLCCLDPAECCGCSVVLCDGLSDCRVCLVCSSQ